MNKTILIIVITLAAAITSGYFLTESNPELKAQAQEIGLRSAPPPVPVPISHNAVFIVFDPSGSGTISYSVPRIDTIYMIQVIEKIQSVGSGDVWLTYVDMNGNNNKVLHFSIPKAAAKLETPVRQSGERKAIFDKRLEVFRTDSTNLAKEIDAQWKRYNAERHDFISKCQELITTGYAPKKRGTDWSDCIGSINAGLRSLETAAHDTLHFRSLLMISDGVQSNGPETPRQKLDTIPKDLAVVTVNHSGSKNNVLKEHTKETDNLDRALEQVIQVYKPKNR